MVAYSGRRGITFALAVLVALTLLLAFGNPPEHAYASGASIPAKGVVKSGQNLEFYSGKSAKPTKTARIQVSHDGFVVADNKLYYFKDESERAVKNRPFAVSSG